MANQTKNSTTISKDTKNSATYSSVYNSWRFGVAVFGKSLFGENKTYITETKNTSTLTNQSKN